MAIVLAGAVAFARLPLATRPVVELPRLTISVFWPGASAELVEAYVSAPVEAAVQAVRGVRRVDSESQEGTARLTVRLHPKTRVQLARLGILERLELLRPDLPQGASAPTVSNYVPQELAEQPLVRITVSGPYTPGALARAVRERLVPRLSALSGVGSAHLSGGAQLGVAVSYDAERLRALGLSPSALAEALQGARLAQPLGERRVGASAVPVVLRDEPASLAALALLPIRGRAGTILKLSDVASVRLEEDTRDQIYRVDALPAVSITVSRLPGADAIRTAALVRRTTQESVSELPLGVRLRIQSDESVDLARQLKDLVVRGIIAFLAVLTVLVIAFRAARPTLLALGSVVVAVGGTALGLYLLGVPANLLCIAGLGMGIGILVQNGVVVVDRLQRTGAAGAARSEAGLKIAPAVLGSTLTTGVVLLPFLYLQGNARAAFAPFAVAFALALAWSVISSVVMLPAMGVGMGRRRARPGRLLRMYTRLIVRLVRWRWVTITLTLGLIGVATWGFVTKVPRFEFGNWYGQRSRLSAYVSFPRGADPSSLDRAAREFERLVVGHEGVDQVITQGSGDYVSLSVSFTRKGEEQGVGYELQELLTQRAILVGGASVGVNYQGPGYFSGGGGGISAFRIKLLGYSFERLAGIAEDLKSRLERIPRVRDVDVNAGSFWRRERAFSITLEPDRAALGRYGLTAQDMARMVSREVSGRVGGQPMEIGGEELMVTLKAQGASRRTIDQLRAALVANPSGAPVRVADLAKVDERQELSAVSRQDQQYVRVISYEFRGPPRLAQRTHRSFLSSVELPAGYSVSDEQFDWGGDESTKGLWLVFAIGVALVILSVAMVFDSVWATAMVFLSLPVALAGSAAAFWIGDVAFTREAAVGVILVVGLAVNQAILLVDAALARRNRRAQAAERLTAADVIHACRDRAPMITLVTLTTLASLLPLAIGADPDQLFGAIALATTGGTLAGTVASLFVLPAVLLNQPFLGLYFTPARPSKSAS